MRPLRTIVHVAFFVIGAAAAIGCSGTGHPRAMREGRGSPYILPVVPGSSGVVGGGTATGGGSGAQGTGDAPPTSSTPRTPNAPPSTSPQSTSSCEALGQCCAGLVADDEAACLAVVQAHDPAYCEEGVQRFCWNVQICDVDGCSSHGGP